MPLTFAGTTLNRKGRAHDDLKQILNKMKKYMLKFSHNINYNVRMHHCINCGGSLEVTKVACPTCRLSFAGQLQLPRLARLNPDEQALAERILLAGGNLKQVAADLEISYPTLRKRVDGMISALEALRRSDDKRCEELLGAVEAGSISPEEAARVMKELNGGI